MLDIAQQYIKYLIIKLTSIKYIIPALSVVIQTTVFPNCFNFHQFLQGLQGQLETRSKQIIGVNNILHLVGF